MSYEQMHRFTCEVCDKEVLVGYTELRLPLSETSSRRVAKSPKGWLLIGGSIYDEWTQGRLGLDSSSDPTYVCSVGCVVRFLHELAEKCEQVFPKSNLVG